jgi:chromosome segregation ATPase
LVNHAGEVAIYRSRLEQQLGAFRSAMAELERTNARLRDQLRRLDLETEAQIVARYQREQDQADQKFDPLELDRFSTLQQLSRALNESAADLGGLQGVLDDLSRQYDAAAAAVARQLRAAGRPDARAHGAVRWPGAAPASRGPPSRRWIPASRST